MEGKFYQEMQNLMEEGKALRDAAVFGTSFVKITYDVERELIIKKRIDPTKVKIGE